ncbi:MAG: hypothetical protein ACE5GS_10820 [Kiloniellaceae bacterium]
MTAAFRKWIRLCAVIAVAALLSGCHYYGPGYYSSYHGYSGYHGYYGHGYSGYHGYYGHGGHYGYRY